MFTNPEGESNTQNPKNNGSENTRAGRFNVSSLFFAFPCFITEAEELILLSSFLVILRKCNPIRCDRL